MHILVTTPYPIWPCTTGGATRTLQISRALSRLGHRITLLSAEPTGPGRPVGGNARWLGFPQRGRSGHFWNTGFSAAYRALLAVSPPDLILGEFPFQAFMLAGPARRARIPLVYDAHNVECDRFRRMGKKSVAALVQFAEAHMNRHAARVLAVSREDAELMTATYGSRCALLPNGVDLERFTTARPDPALVSQYGLNGQKVLLFFGPLDYGPNLDALRFLLDTVWPRVRRIRCDARLLVVGRRPPDWAKGRADVIITGQVDDIVPHIQLADLVLAPITSGGGTRLKILEALACSQRVIATPFAAVSIAGEGVPGLVVVSPQRFTQEILHALDDSGLGPGREATSRELVARFGWDRLVSEIDWYGIAHRL